MRTASRCPTEGEGWDGVALKWMKLIQGRTTPQCSPFSSLFHRFVALSTLLPPNPATRLCHFCWGSTWITIARTEARTTPFIPSNTQSSLHLSYRYIPSPKYTNGNYRASNFYRNRIVALGEIRPWTFFQDTHPQNWGSVREKWWKINIAPQPWLERTKKIRGIP